LLRYNDSYVVSVTFQCVGVGAVNVMAFVRDFLLLTVVDSGMGGTWLTYTDVAITTVSLIQLLFLSFFLLSALLWRLIQRSFFLHMPFFFNSKYKHTLFQDVLWIWSWKDSVESNVKHVTNQLNQSKPVCKVSALLDQR